MRYEKSEEMRRRVDEVIDVLNLSHVRKGDIECIKSWGSKSNAVARCYALNKVMQLALNRKAFYVLEFISEKFEHLSDDEKTRIIIHELMHIPKSFGGGFRHHDFVCSRNIDKLHKEYLRRKGESKNKF